MAVTTVQITYGAPTHHVGLTTDARHLTSPNHLDHDQTTDHHMHADDTIPWLETTTAQVLALVSVYAPRLTPVPLHISAHTRRDGAALAAYLADQLTVYGLKTSTRHDL